MGKPSAFSALASLYVGYRPWLVDRLRFRLRNHADAEDLASETFLQVATGRDPAQIAEPKAYLSTIARRLLFHFWRRRELEQAYLQWLALHAEEKRDKSGETAEINPGHRGMGRDLSGWNCKSLTESGRVI